MYAASNLITTCVAQTITRLLLRRNDEILPKARRSGSDLLVTALHHAKCLLAAKVAEAAFQTVCRQATG